MYSTESLERGIEALKKNIKTFEEAIEKERTRIKEYHEMIDALNQKKREAKAIELIEGKNVNIRQGKE